MLIAGKYIAIALAALLANVLLNQLPELRDFKGRTGLLIRLILWLTFIAVAHDVLNAEAVSQSAKTVFYYGVAAAVMGLVYEGAMLVSAVRAANTRRKDPAAIALASSVGYAPELRVKLLAEVNRQVEQRLKSAYGEQTLVNLEMHPAPDDVEGETRTSNVFLVPKAKQSVESFKDDRMRTVRSEETILDTFENEAILGQLLILGAPGSGKTTALLTLAQALLAQADITGIEIPYIFELSAWPKTEPDIASWLMAQLAFEHNIKETVSREWILNGQLLPLLDGLDELATDRRQACIEPI